MVSVLNFWFPCDKIAYGSDLPTKSVLGKSLAAMSPMLIFPRLFASSGLTEIPILLSFLSGAAEKSNMYSHVLGTLLAYN